MGRLSGIHRRVSTADELQARIDAIEESYEFFLAYAAQGVAGSQASKSSGQVREFLERMEHALSTLPDLFSAAVIERGESTEERYQSFVGVLRQDADNSLAAVRMVLVQPGIGSQMIDNLNALIHLRALLTDVFLIDEILNPRLPGGGKPRAG
jgi:hypothetical protein